MGITAGFCTLKAQFIIPDFPFESAHFDLVQRRWDFMAEDSQAKSKELNNGLIKLPRAVLKVSFCSKCVNKTAENYRTYCGRSLWI